MLCPCKWFTEMAKWLTCVHNPYDSCLLYVVELVWLDPVKGVQMTHLLSSSDVIYTRVIKRDSRTGLVRPGCLLLRILLPCRIMTPACTRLCQSVLDCDPSGWWVLWSWIIWQTISSWQQIAMCEWMVLHFVSSEWWRCFSGMKRCSPSDNSVQVSWSFTQGSSIMTSNCST